MTDAPGILRGRGPRGPALKQSARTNSPQGCSARRGTAKQVPSGKLAADLSALGSSTAEVAQPCVPAIELREVSFSYGKLHRSSGGSPPMFPHGAVTSVVGPNGCGKSTMIKLVDGSLRPSAGEVRIDGVPTLSLKAKERARRVAVLAQASRPPAMTVEALVACGRYPYQARQGKALARGSRARGARPRAGGRRAVPRLQELRRLSGGERQRAFIAMTLAQDTDLIVLDEPTTYLDIRACHETMELVRRLNDEAGKTVVMVIHDLDLALRYSDRLLVMERGRAAAAGTVEEVLATGAIERAFGVSIRPHAAAEGIAPTRCSPRSRC